MDTARFQRLIVIAGVLLALATPAWVLASSVGLPNVFTNGTVADADQVNANFNALKAAVDDNHARLTVVEQDVRAVRAKPFSRSVAAALSPSAYNGLQLFTTSFDPLVAGNHLTLTLVNLVIAKTAGAGTARAHVRLLYADGSSSDLATLQHSGAIGTTVNRIYDLPVVPGFVGTVTKLEVYGGGDGSTSSVTLDVTGYEHAP